MAAAKTQKKSKVIIDRKRDGSTADIYVGAVNTIGKFEHATIPLNKEVEVDDNLLQSIKLRQETVREKKGKAENLVLKPIYTIEKVD
jgi:hypothetical protein